MNRCDICGKFAAEDDLYSLAAEGEDIWFECVKCLSQADREHFRIDDTREKLKQSPQESESGK